MIIQILNWIEKTLKKKAFVQEKIDDKWIISFIIIQIGLVFSISLIFFPPIFTFIMGLMLINQILYTLPPFRLKNTPFAPLTSTATNSVLRIASCCVLLGNLFIVPPLVYLFMYMASLGTYLLYKEKNKTATIIGMITVILLAYLFYSGSMNLIQFGVAVLTSLIASIPLYISLFKDKEKMLEIADILYHKVAFLFYAITILYLLIASDMIELI